MALKSHKEFVAPGYGGGLQSVFRQRYLLSLIVKKELEARYHGSVLGIAWSYVKPATQFFVYFFAMGVFLGLRNSPSTTPYPIHLFAGIVVINYFSEILTNCTRTLVVNAPLIKKIYLPREMFPVSSVWVALVHFFPQVVVLIVASLCYGWRPTFMGVVGAFIGFIIVTLFALGLGFIFGSINVYFRDAENIVDLLLLVVMWASPVLYALPFVLKNTPKWFGALYEYNPITVAVVLFHRAFWSPISGNYFRAEIPSIYPFIFKGLIVAVMTIFIGQLVFKKLEGRFAQEL